MKSPIGKEGCSKRKVKLIEKDSEKAEERLEEVTNLYDGAVEAMPWGAQRGPQFVVR